MYCVCIFPPSNASFIEFINVCSLVLITSWNLNPRFLLRLHDSSVLQSIIIFNAKSLRINLLFGCFIGSSVNSYLCFLHSSSHLFVTACTLLRPNYCSTCLSFSHNVLRLSVTDYFYAIAFTHFFGNINHFIYTQEKNNFFVF